MKRFQTRSVKIGSIYIGSNHPIAIQSMTNTDTNDVLKTVDQILALYDEGASVVRITVQGKKEASSAEKIKNLLVKKNCPVPLVADIHFYPPAALFAAEFMDKIRINPGNYADPRASLMQRTYSEKEYLDGEKKVEDKFTPLILACKKREVAMRIGVNHGSLSDRILYKYGNTPKGMVESAIEFAEICRKNDFHQMVFSMKSSNPGVMMEAYRLLVEEMLLRGWDYPLHLGVTEAGSGLDGRVKSFLGIGGLLLQGLGDTIRISLTENPVEEIKPCKELIAFCEKRLAEKDLAATLSSTIPKTFSRKKSPFLVLSLEEKEALEKDFLQVLGFEEEKPTLKTPEALFFEKEPKNVEVLKYLESLGVKIFVADENTSFTPVFFKKPSSHFKPFARHISSLDDLDGCQQASYIFFDRKLLDEVENLSEKVGSQKVLLLMEKYNENNFVVGASSEIGPFLSEGLINGFCLSSKACLQEKIDLSLSIMQAARIRSTKTEFISCPSCGRTLFDLEEVSKKIEERTKHLPGVKIAIMGCIVNGPGEMADADFGYVGSRPGKIDLYVGKTCVKKHIDFADAVDELVDLLKKHGRWKEPKPLLK